MFVEGIKVSYDTFEGVVDFVGDSYIVIEISSTKSSFPARLLIYKHNYKYVKVL